MIKVKKSKQPDSVTVLLNDSERCIGTPLWSLHDVKETIRIDFRGKCGLCEKSLNDEDMHPVGLDLPFSSNRPGDWGQLLLACKGCSDAWSKTLRESKEIPEVLSPCSQQTNFSDHLTSNFSGQLIGTTLIGRRTIDMFDLNRKKLVIARRERCKKMLIKHRQNSRASGQLKVNGIPAIGEDEEFSFFLKFVCSQYIDFSMMCDVVLDAERQMIADEFINNELNSSTNSEKNIKMDRASIALSVAKRLNRYLMLTPNWHGIGIDGNKAIEDLISILEE